VKTRSCVQCHCVYEYYERWHIVPDCPRCGASGGYAPPIVWPLRMECLSPCGCKEESNAA
jgi:hypothetical protein